MSWYYHTFTYIFLLHMSIAKPSMTTGNDFFSSLHISLNFFAQARIKCTPCTWKFAAKAACGPRSE